MVLTLIVFKGEDLLHVLAFTENCGYFIVKLIVGDKAVNTLAVIEDVFVICFGHGRIDGYIYSANLQKRVVHNVPFATVVVRDQRNLIAMFNTKLEQCTARLVYGFNEFFCTV
ncbi:MAG: Uncharacterised protein [Cryomorphaceae bacterium]|nr:MAG: Uncharacterised protein [Cryomorphaceae bacterium]